MAIAGIILGFSKGWKLALVMTSAVPLIFLSTYFFSWSSKEITKYNL